MKVIHFHKKITCYFMVKSKKCHFGRFVADWPFGLLLRLIVLAIKKKSLENKSNSFLQKNHLLFYGKVQKMPFRPICGQLVVWAVTASNQLGPGKAVKLQEIRISTRYQATVVNEDHLVGGKPRRQTTARCSGPDIPVERNALEESGDAGSDFPCTNEGCSAQFNTIADMHDHLAGGICQVVKNLKY